MVIIQKALLRRAADELLTFYAHQMRIVRHGGSTNPTLLQPDKTVETLMMLHECLRQDPVKRCRRKRRA
jgi:hypothetical protein